MFTKTNKPARIHTSVETKDFMPRRSAVKPDVSTFTTEEILAMIQFPKDQVRVCGIVRRVVPKPEMGRVFGDISYGGATIGFSLPVEQAPQVDAPIVIAGLLSLRHDQRSFNALYRYGVQITGRIIDSFSPYVAGTDVELIRNEARLSVSEVFQTASNLGRLRLLVLCSQTAKNDMEATFSTASISGWPLEIVYEHIPFFSAEKATEAIRAAVENLNPDMIALARGGGAADEIAVTANSPSVVKALLDPGVPVYSAVGHAHDVSLTDKYSDESFHTPTAFAAALTQSWGRHLGVQRTYERLNTLEQKVLEQDKTLAKSKKLLRISIVLASGLGAVLLYVGMAG